jgi:hypothetical protein
MQLSQGSDPRASTVTLSNVLFAITPREHQFGTPLAVHEPHRPGGGRFPRGLGDAPPWDFYASNTPIASRFWMPRFAVSFSSLFAPSRFRKKVVGYETFVPFLRLYR